MTDSKTREAFEAWARSVMPGCDISLLPGSGGAYCNIILEARWTAYQAARRAALEEAAKACEGMQFPSRDQWFGAIACAAAIRALADETQEGRC